MESAASPPRTVADVLGSVLKRVDPDQQLRAYHLWTFWREEVGEAIAKRAQPERIRNGILFVTVASHSWMHELQFMKEDMRVRLNGRLGAELIRDIFFISGAIPPAPEGDEPRQRPAAVPPGGPLVALPPIADPELAAAFARLLDARARRVLRTAP
jgi:hypothetical protein